MPKWGYGPPRSPLTRSHLGLSAEGPACTKHERAFGIPGSAVERFTKDICQLSAMKQITVLRTQNGNRELAKQEESAEDGDVTFHEPLEYLDGDTRKLVLRVVGDQI